VTCPCGNKSHDYDKMFSDAARRLLKNPDNTREIFRHWLDPKHHAHKSPSFLAMVRAKIEALKTGELI